MTSNPRDVLYSLIASLDDHELQSMVWDERDEEIARLKRKVAKLKKKLKKAKRK